MDCEVLSQAVDGDLGIAKAGAAKKRTLLSMWNSTCKAGTSLPRGHRYEAFAPAVGGIPPVAKAKVSLWPIGRSDLSNLVGNCLFMPHSSLHQNAGCARCELTQLLMVTPCQLTRGRYQRLGWLLPQSACVLQSMAYEVPAAVSECWPQTCVPSRQAGHNHFRG